VIADANTTREKLGKQTKALEEVFEKTKKLETSLDTQGKKLEETVSKSTQIESAVEEAKQLLGRLEKETAYADQKIAILNDKTRDIERLPDGRVKVGGMITGKATKLQEIAEKMDAAAAANNVKDGYKYALEMVAMVEASEAVKSVAQLGGINRSALSELFILASDFARISSESSRCIEWAKKAMKYEDSGRSRAAVVIALIVGKQGAEADKLIEETRQKPAFMEGFTKTLKLAGIELR